MRTVLLRIRVHDGSGVCRNLRGEGTIARRMLLPFDLPAGWRDLTGAIAWHRDETRFGPRGLIAVDDSHAGLDLRVWAHEGRG